MAAWESQQSDAGMIYHMHQCVPLLHAWMLVLLALSKCIPATYESIRWECMNRSLFKPLYRIKPRVVSYPHPRRLSSPRHRMMLPRITDSHPRPHTGWPPLLPPLPFKIPGWILCARALATDDSEYFNLHTAFWGLYIYIWIWITDKKIMWEIEDCSCASWSSRPLLWAVKHRIGMFDSRTNRSFEQTEWFNWTDLESHEQIILGWFRCLSVSLW